MCVEWGVGGEGERVMLCVVCRHGRGGCAIEKGREGRTEGGVCACCVYVCCMHVCMFVAVRVVLCV